ncbi:MAG: phage head closure protein [Lachnospiraceae bacterium]|nr:phage head closure protein [Lachnospiraceae bacterium]
MKISLLSERLTIQKNSVVIDSVGNHKNEWTDYYSCYGYAATSGYQQKEQQAAGIMVSDEGLVFTVRYCSELADLDSTHFRVLFRGEPYNITAVDRMNYQRKTLKITCEKERRDT